jgi:twinkle protein
MAKFIKHSNCPQCGSKDNLAVYDEFSMCMTPGCNYKTGTKAMINQQETEIVPVEYVTESIPDVLINERKLTEETINRFRVGIRTHSSGAKMVSFPYISNGQVLWVKNRGLVARDGKADIWKDKKFWAEGTSTNVVKLFGTQNLDERKRGVVVTEGEIDCLAAYQMFGLKHNVVSIANGAQSAKECLIKHMSLLDKFDAVYICFDMDNPGRQAAEEVMKLFSPGKAYNVLLPDGYKDASDMLMAGKDREFRDSVSQAQSIQPDGVLTKDEIVNTTLKYILNLNDNQGYSTGYPSLDKFCGGVREGELFTLAANTGIGKSSLAFNLAYNSIAQDKPTLIIPLEMAYKTVYTRMVEIHMKRAIFHTDMNEFTIPPLEELKKSLEYVSANLHCLNMFGAMEHKKLISTVEFYCRCFGVKFVVLDHLHAAITGSTDDGYKSIDYIMSELKRVSLQYSCCVLVISHVSRSKDDKDDTQVSLSRIRGSSGIAHYSDFVMGLARPRDTNQAVITTMKAHRIFGVYGTAILEYDKDTCRYYDNYKVNTSTESHPATKENGFMEEHNQEVKQDSPNSFNDFNNDYENELLG